MSCLDETAVQDLVEGRLPAEAAEAARAHVADCDDCRTLLATGAMALVPRDGAIGRGSTVGRYVVLGLLRSGGMGSVYTAYDPDLDRKVALKLIRPDLGSRRHGAWTELLLREAKMMAKVSHPNVVPIYDVGMIDEQLFIAMELVDGGNLREWLRMPRRRREVLAIFLQAARGLAAAHKASVVHRDFKPENVLIGADGRVRVGDFGLALPPDDAATSLVGGTPGYMAPEQEGGLTVAAAADQFSFCVALREAIQGVSPQHGSAAERGRPRTPRFIERVLRRGLQPDPQQRFASMDELANALERRRRWPAVAAVALVLALGGLGGLKLLSTGERCRGAARQLTGVWDDSRIELVRASFAASATPYKESAYVRVKQTLDAYAAEWVAQRERVCESVGRLDEPTDELAGGQMQCLARRREDLRAFVDVLARADSEVIEHAASAAWSLPKLRACEDAHAGERRMARHDERIDRRLARARALFTAGKYLGAEGELRAVEPDVRRTGDPVLLAQVLSLLGSTLERADRFPEADAALREAWTAAHAGTDDLLLAEVAIRLGAVAAVGMGQADAAEEWADLAAATLHRLGGDQPAVAARLESLRGYIATHRGNYAAALEHDRAALKLRTTEDVNAPDVAESLAEAGEDLEDLARYDEALPLFERALAILRNSFGERHPKLGYVLTHEGIIACRRGRFEECRARCAQTIDVLTPAAAENARLIADASACLADGLDGLGRGAEALAAAERALDLRERLYSPTTHISLLRSLSQLADLLDRAGRRDEAWRYFKLAQTRAADHAEPLARVEVDAAIGRAELRRSRADAARRAFERALTLEERIHLETQPLTDALLVGLGVALEESGHPDEAQAPLTRALASLSARPGDPALTADCQIALARCLDRLNRPGAIELARRALVTYAALPDPHDDRGARVRRWLATREGDGQ